MGGRRAAAWTGAHGCCIGSGMSPPSENRDAVERRERLAHARAARARRPRGLDLLLISFGVAIWLVDVLVFVVLRLKGVLLGMVPAAISILVIAVSVALVTLGRRMRIGDAERVLTGDTRAPIVYLRPFGADSAKITKRMSSRVRISPRERIEKTYEERLARALRKIGPFVAVGDPAERLPLLGAARMYAADEDWQTTVDELIGHARVVLLHAGEGEGFTWEVRHVIERGAPQRAILSLPLDAKRTEPSALRAGARASLALPVAAGPPPRQPPGRRRYIVPGGAAACGVEDGWAGCTRFGRGATYGTLGR